MITKDNKYHSKNNERSITVTVGVPYCDKTNPHFLKKSLDSIVCQSLYPTSIHLIQDGPIYNKNLIQLVDKFLSNGWNNVEKLVILKNLGLAHALNVSILNCNTKYYARMDDDDISDPKRLEKQITFLEENPEIDILGSWAYEFKGSTPEEGSLFLKKVPVQKRDIRRFFHYRSPFIHPSVVFRRSVFAKIGLYNTKFKTSQDTELWGRALKYDVGVANLPEPLLYYRAAGLAQKRSDISSVLRIAKAQFSYKTYSPYLNLLKLASIGFRLLPQRIRKWGYDHLRNNNISNSKKIPKDNSSFDL